MVYFALAVRAHVQAWPRRLLVCGFSGAANAAVHLDGEGCHCYRLGSDGSCKLLHHLLDHVQFLVGSCIHCACRIFGSIGEDGLAIHAGLKLYDALSPCVGLFFQCRSVVHC